MFVDQVEFVAEHLRRGLMVAAQTGRISRQSMKKTLIETAGTMTHRAMCTLCKASRCSMPTACLHVAGTPCVDWSSMPGSSHSKECGNSALPFYAWAALRYLVQDLVIVHENVPSFDPSLLEYLLGSVYVVCSLIIDLVQLGFPCRRKRRITILIHRQCVADTISPWTDSLVARCHRRLNLCFRSLLISTQEEQQAELDWAQTRKDLVGNDKKIKDALDVQASPFVQALTTWELQNLRHSRRRYPRCAYMLGQDAVVFGNHSGLNELQCLIKNVGLLFSDLDNRWLVPKELIAFQRFPCYPSLKSAVFPERCGFDAPRELCHGLGPRDRARTGEQAGNSMPVPLIAVAIIYSLGFTNIASVQKVPRGLGSFALGSLTASALSTLASSRRTRGLKRALSLGPPDESGKD